MNQAAINSKFFNVGGAVPQDLPSYVTRESDQELYEALKAGEFCYVLNSRQMGKSSLMVRTLSKLQAEGWAGITIDFSAKGSASDNSERWYNGIISKINSKFKLLKRKDCNNWLREQDFISPVERLGEFIETVLLAKVESQIVILIDEIDSTINLPFTDDFFALIRSYYNKRAEDPIYKRLTFAFFGVAAPSELISDTKRTPFNIGKSINLKGFTLGEAFPLAEGLAVKSDNSRKVLQEILSWSGGQPFLTQRLCQLVVDSSFPITSGSEEVLIEKLVRSRVIENWESQDQQEHLKTIRRRLLDNEQKAGYLLELYRQVRQEGELQAQEISDEQDLRLTGLVVKRDGKLQVYNPIYNEIFDEAWIDTELNRLRPYAESFRAWIASGKADNSRLLRGKALIEAEQWAVEKAGLSAEDKEFLAASRTQLREEEIAEKEKEAELEREKKKRETAEEAERIQTEANKNANRRIRIGSIALGVTLLGAVIAAIFGFEQVKKAQVAQEDARNAQNNAQVAIEKQQDAERQQNAVEAQLKIQTVQLEKAKKDKQEADLRVKQAQEQENQAIKQKKEAEKQTQKAKQQETQAKQALELVESERSNLEQEVQTLDLKATNAQEKAKEAEKLEQRAIQELNRAEQEKTDAENELKAARENLTKTNKSLETVRNLSILAGELRQNGNVEASNEALSKAGLSTIIQNPELKETFLNAAIAEAYQSLGNTQKAEEILNGLNLESLDSKSQLDPNILNQVKAFAYFEAGKVREDKANYYQDAYEALKASNFDPFNSNPETDVLNEEDVENIHYQLIRSREIDINSDNHIAVSFREHLYAGLESLLDQDRLQDADYETFEIMLYIAGQWKYKGFSIESIENFNCEALREIDEKWVNYPKPRKGHFGFSVQKEVWKKNGSPTFEDWNSGKRGAWRQFYIDVGWKTEESGIETSEGYELSSTLWRTNTLTSSNKGNLPNLEVRAGNSEWLIGHHDNVILFSRCEL